MKLCKDCAHARNLGAWTRCENPAYGAVDLVTGEMQWGTYFADSQRAHYGDCKPEGRGFTPKPPPPPSLLSRLINYLFGA